MSKEIDQAVDAYLKQCGHAPNGERSLQGVVYKAVLLGETTRDNNWKCDAWRVSFNQYTTDYYTGVGHRTKPKQSWLDSKPVKPSAASVLYSLLLDADASTMSLQEWCDSYGYDSDSIKALNIYQQCESTCKELNKVFTREQLAHLSELLQDY